MSYNKYYSEWAENPLSFWDEKAKDVSWIEPYKKTLQKLIIITNGFIKAN